MLTDMGIETGVSSVEGLLEVTEFLQQLLGHPLPSRVFGAGPRWSVSAPTKRAD
jgi:hypothetical protein